MLASLPEAERKAILASLTEEQAEELQWDWGFWARKNQQHPPGKWLTWLILTGRGWGKTRAGAETIRQWLCGSTPLAAGQYRRVALIAETAADARDVMVEGESGILAVHPPAFRPLYEPSKRRVTWPNGAVATLFNATEPDQLRGPQFDSAWCDELAKWQYARETWDMLQFGLRLGDMPRQIVTTTPRPISVIKELIAAPTTVITRGATRENRGNLAPAFLRQIQARYAGTRLGRQELDGEVVDDNPNALWNRSLLDQARPAGMKVPVMARTVVAIDPSGTKGNDEGDDIGIVAAARGTDGLLYVLADKTLQASPDKWGRAAVNLYHQLDADRVVAERNFGGAMVEHVVRSVDPNVAYKEVTASRGKWIRAEPVAALYEQGKVRHVGSLPQLEDEMCAFGPDGLSDGKSPNRLDALVWAATELMLGETGQIVKRSQWSDWTDKNYPSCSYILGALSLGFSEKAAHEPASLTIWGAFHDQGGTPQVILLYSWEGRLQASELASGLRLLCSTERKSASALTRLTRLMGLETAPRFPVDRLVISSKGSGDAVRREIAAASIESSGFLVELVDPSRWGDAIARLHGVQQLFADRSVWASSAKPFAKKVIDNVCEFPEVAHDGLTNSATLALQYMRDTGLLLRAEEHARNVNEIAMHRPQTRPLYPV